MTKGERAFWEAQLQTEKQLLRILINKWAYGVDTKDDIVRTKKFINRIQEKLSDGLGE